ncbi:ComF family protein [Geoalkalibacter halelectricus]|nr:ComF family protein [Geoalkalibacter halelectricus]MDO3378597.1 ComF family protein [Geoalkalibacter halelectricus]
MRLFLPPCCPLCDQPLGAKDQDGFCAVCRDAFRLLASPCCPRCSLPYAAADGSDHLCENCTRQEPPFVWAAAAAHYEGALRDAVQLFKFGRRLDLDRPLAALLLAATGERIRAFAPDLIVAVPLHAQRLRQRGYNQAQLLARILAKDLRLAAPARLLRRVRPTALQQGLPRQERHRNLRRAFHAQGAVAGRRVLLVDDVLTTGATLSACSQALLDGGAAAVAAVALARTSRQARLLDV